MSIEVVVRFIRFALLLLLAIPSTFCSIYIIYSSIRFSLLRRYFYYQILILLSFLALLQLILNIPVALSYHARGYTRPQTGAFCRYWEFIDYTSSGCIIWCNAIFTVERYLLVFHPRCLRSKWQKRLLHYLPILLANVYIIGFYTCTVLILPCKVDHDYESYLCGGVCMESRPTLSTVNWLFNVLFPVFIVIFGSSFILIRVIWTRRKMQRNLRNWSKNWKMIVQLLGIALVYSLIWLPLSVLSVISTFATHPTLDSILDDYLYHFIYLADISVPIITVIFSPEINRHLRLRRQVQPMVATSMASKDTVGY